MSSSVKQVFHFKQFTVDQTGCAMKINTDGVLLGTFATADNPQAILDIGTGTGVIALMLAQRFGQAYIDAVEIDQEAAATAGRNFSVSPFADRLAVHAGDFRELFEKTENKKYDLIVSNPPFYIDSLTSPAAKKNLAKHAGSGLFNELIESSLLQLTEQGVLWLILPVNTAQLVRDIAAQQHLYLQKSITIHSFENSQPHREVLAFGLHKKPVAPGKFVIYDTPKVYSRQYQEALVNFFIVF